MDTHRGVYEVAVTLIFMENNFTVQQVSAKLRAIRRSKSLSLNDVEALSKGLLKAVVLGSYERGARSLSVKRAIDIAALYNVPVSQFFSEKACSSQGPKPRLILDLRLMKMKIQREERNRTAGSVESHYCDLKPFLDHIIHVRQDWNGEVISLRDSDISIISLLAKKDEEDAWNWLIREEILLQKR